jgi:proline iminopeptidase
LARNLARRFQRKWELTHSFYFTELHFGRSFWEEHGNPLGVPVVFLHGGPGGGIEPRSHRFFDPDAYRIVLFSQRGCGRSTPRGCLAENTTWSLVSDIEALRKDRGIESWVVFGGSWGSTLSLAYAQINPSRVRALILRGIFTLRQAEIAWFYERGGAELLMPAAFEQYAEGLPKEMRHRSSLLDAFHEVLNSDDAEAASRAAVAWSRWEGACTYIETVVEKNKYEEPEFAGVFARIEAHFFKNKGFFERDGFLLEAEQIAKIQHIPTVIVQPSPQPS